MNNLIIFFTRVPKVGTTKTRLYDFVTPNEAVKIQKKLIKENYDVLKSSGYNIKVYHDGSEADNSFMETLTESREFYYQQGATLGEKMFSAIAESECSFDKVILLGSDIVNLSVEIIENAFSSLENHDIVINPSEDGGYYLIGMKRSIREVFDIDNYGDSSVLEKVIAKCKQYDYSYSLGQKLYDIDTKEDLLFYETSFENIKLLGAGEYNINFTYDHDDSQKRVLRINMKSQMNLDNQMEYEYETLKLLEGSGVTPKPFDLYLEPRLMPYKFLTMEYLANRRALDYNKDMEIASYLLSKVHNHSFSKNSLIEASNPFQLMYDECKSMAEQYILWDKADKIVVNYLTKFLDVCHGLIPKQYSVDKPCIINTELNSGNFLIGKDKEDSYVIDWEKALIGECEQDLAHFLAPTTTFWKTDKILTKEEIEKFLADYSNYRTYSKEKFNRYFIFTCLRGVTWCSMAYRQYSEKDKMLMDSYTFNKISSYVSYEFLDNISKYF